MMTDSRLARDTRLKSGLQHPGRWLLILATLLALPALAEPEFIDNPAEPAAGLQTATMTELWRAGGLDDDVFFGTVGAVKYDGDGNILVLDTQLSQVHIYSTDGELLRTVGREGDGPGEVRRPADMFLNDDGTICLLQSMPGRIVKITSDGLPAGEATYAATAGAQNQFAILNQGYFDPAGMLLVGIRMQFSGGGASTQTYFLSRCNDEGLQTHSFLEKEHVINYNDLELNELAMDFVYGRVAIDRKGRVAVAPERNAYRVDVFAADGMHDFSFGRPYTSPARNAEQTENARKLIEGIGAYYPTPPVRIGIEDTEPDIGRLHIDDEGRIWVGTSRGGLDCPDGTWTMMDVFSPEGRFERQVAFSGDYNPNEDGLTLLPGGLAVVITGALDAFLTQQGVAGDETEEEAEPLELICYRIDME